jgi:CopG family nickel-responsive transcriptional regulator
MLAGTITLVYRGDRGRVRHQLAQTQADYLVISSQHVFLEDDQSLEVLLVQGPAVRLKALCDALRGIRGVHQLELVTTTALLPPLYEQDDIEADGSGAGTEAPRGARGAA